MAVIVCDVNETLLDLAGLDEPLGAAFGARAGEVKRLWFARLLQTATLLTLFDSWQDFGVIGRATLLDVAERLDLPVTGDQAGSVIERMRHLPPHDDVTPGLRRLTDAGARLVALTNSGQATAEAQLASAGIDGWFERIMSADAVLAFKPDRTVYDHCREQLGVPASELIMLATHDWDCAGALKAGWRSGFVRRRGQAYHPLLQPATYVADGFDALAARLVADGLV